jgi:hypothetical protein
MEEREEGNTWLTAGGKRAVLSTHTQSQQGMMQSCNGQQNGGSHVIRVGRWCIVFLPGTMVGLRVERLLTRDPARRTADLPASESDGRSGWAGM